MEGIIKIKSKLIIFLICLTLFIFLIGMLAILLGGAPKMTADLFKKTEPVKLHIYSYLRIVFQVILYSFLFWLPGFSITLAIYPKLPLSERSVISLALSALLYAFYVNVFIAITKLDFFVAGQIVFDLSYVFMVSFLGLVFWRIRLIKNKTKNVSGDL
ncbi:MAG: hypothetical protein PHF44_02505 [Candidatus Pacebacteria bacterium]|nr:hypothetical protein [Candidatus Paceibacterota bacterium]